MGGRGAHSKCRPMRLYQGVRDGGRYHCNLLIGVRTVVAFSNLNLSRHFLRDMFHSGRSIGIQAAIMQMLISKMRQSALGIPAQVSSGSFTCQDMVVRIMQTTAVMRPRPMRRLRASFWRRGSFILRRRRIGKVAPITSVKTEMPNRAVLACLSS